MRYTTPLLAFCALIIDNGGSALAKAAEQQQSAIFEFETDFRLDEIRSSLVQAINSRLGKAGSAVPVGLRRVKVSFSAADEEFKTLYRLASRRGIFEIRRLASVEMEAEICRQALSLKSEVNDLVVNGRTVAEWVPSALQEPDLLGAPA